MADGQRKASDHPVPLRSPSSPTTLNRSFDLRGIAQVRTGPYCPQSNGKLERHHKTLKSDCIRPKCPLSLEEAKRVVKQFVSDYNDCRLHSSIGSLTPSDMLARKQKAIHEERDRKLEEAREDRAKIRAQQAAARYAQSTRPEDIQALLPTPIGTCQAKTTLCRRVTDKAAHGEGMAVGSCCSDVRRLRNLL